MSVKDLRHGIRENAGQVAGNGGAKLGHGSGGIVSLGVVAKLSP
jgi:hypothetical protein